MKTKKRKASLILKILSTIPILLLTLNVSYVEASKGFDYQSCKFTSQKKGDSDRFHGVWRKTNEDVILRTGLKLFDFPQERSRLQARGYIITDFEFFTKEGVLKLDAVFKKGSGRDPERRIIFHTYSKVFSETWKNMSKEGFVLLDIETYVSHGKRLWAGIFERGSGKTALWRNFNTKDFGKKRDEMAKQGRKLVDIEVHVVNNKPRWSGVWVEGKDGMLNRNYSLKQFDKMRINRRNNGYKLIDVETYKLKNKIYYAGVWEKSSDREYFNSFHSMCDILDKHNNRSNDGYELIDWERVKNP